MNGKSPLGQQEHFGHKNLLHQGTVAHKVVHGYTVTVPTVLRIDGFRYFFYSGDREEPVHVHVEKTDASAKVWIRSVRLDRSHGFSNTDIATILRHVEENSEVME